MRGVPSLSDPGEFVLDVLSTYTLRTPSSMHAQLCMTHPKLCKVGVKMQIDLSLESGGKEEI